MGKAKRKHPDLEEILQRPWCYYCERDFDDLKILINHQKAKHFKCERCGRRLNTAGGLSVHMTQVHKETLTTIENALPNRSGLDVEIFGMEGIPDDVVQSHNQRVVTQFAHAEAERRAATGNPGPGAAGGGQNKKPKFESPAEMKKRLAEHKAKKSTEEAAGISSGGNTPGGIGQDGQSPGMGQSPGNYAGSPSYPSQQMPFGVPSNNTGYPSYPQAYGQQPLPVQQQASPFSPQQQAFNPPGAPQYQMNPAFGTQPFQSPGGPGFPSQLPSGLPFQGGGPPFQNIPQFSNGPSQFQNGSLPQFQNGQPPFPNGPPSFGAGSMTTFQQNQYQPPRNHTPPQHSSIPQRPGSLPPAPGLPQRPSFGAPPVNAFQMQQMHQGQLSGPPSQSDHSHHSQQQGVQSASVQMGVITYPNPPTFLSANASSLDDLVSGAAQDADKAANGTEKKQEMPKIEELVEEKKGKKEKDKTMRLVYADNEISPEEKMAKMPRYAFIPSG